MRHLVLIALAAGLGLAGCTGPVNRGLESANQPAVGRLDYAIDLHRGGEGLDAGEPARLSAWFDSLRLGYGDRVSVDDPAGVPGARSDIASVTAHYGLLLDERAPVLKGEVPADAVRVVVSRPTADVPGCPNWDRPSQPEYAASTTSNYGCASNRNLAMMVANKEDLVHGEEAAGTDPRVTARAIKAYRDAPATGAGNTIKSESSKGGN